MLQVDPRLGVQSQTGNSSAANAQFVLDMLAGRGNLNPLPDGWEERATKEGRVFFVDHSTSTVFYT